MRFKTIFPIINKPIIFSLVIVFVLMTVSRTVETLPRRVNKLLIFYSNGKHGIVYTFDRPDTYISSHGGPTVIVRVRLLKRWFIDERGSLYGKDLKATEPNSTSKRLAGAPFSAKYDSVNIGLTGSYVGRNREAPVSPLEKTSRRQMVDLPNRTTILPPVKPKLAEHSSSTQSKNTSIPSQHKNSRNVEATPSVRPIWLFPTTLKRIARYEKPINLYAEKYKLEPNLLKAVIYVESSGNPDAASNKGAKGLMQLTDDTAEDMNVQNVFDPMQNIEGGAKYLRQQLNTFQNNLSLALAAYNSGPGHVKRKVFFRETKKYVKKVLAVKKSLSVDAQR